MGMPDEEQEMGIPEWVVTFGDMMSLLLTFFIMLYSMSELKEDEAQAMIESMRHQFGHDRSITAFIPGDTPPTKSRDGFVSNAGRAMRENIMMGGARVKAPVGDNPRVRAIREAQDATVGTVIYFDEGSDVLSAANREILKQVAAKLDGKRQTVTLWGHTTRKPLPKGSKYPSHDHLAFERARRVKDELIRLGIEPDRLFVMSASSNAPENILPEEESRKRNARVEIVMGSELVDELQGTREQRNQRFYSE